jgi:hypothetical protein
MRSITKNLACALALLAGGAVLQPAAAQGFFDRLFRSNQPPQPEPVPSGAAVIIPGFGPVYGRGPGLGTPHVLIRRDNLPIARQNVVVFVAAGCPQCFEAVEDVRRQAVAGMEVLDVTSSSMARDAFNMLGSRGLPTTVAGSAMLVGRDPQLLTGVLSGAGLQAPDANRP